MSLKHEPFVSIIIPTYQDWERLKLCINALQKQTYAKFMFEVVIVNNDPEDSIPSDVILPDNFKIIDESKSGSYAARNAAISIANGEILGFTDSDCLPAEKWIENAVKVLDQGNCDRIAGNIEIFYENEDDPTNAELYEKVFAFKQAEVAKNMGSAVTGNMFARKKVFDAVGLFNESLFSGGDHEWARRAQAKGFAIVYAEDVTIYHPARKSLQELLKKAKRVGGGAANLLSGKRAAAIKEYIGSFKPSFYAWYMIRNYGKGMSFVQKGKVFILRAYIMNVTNLEKLKVAFGKQPNRA